MTTKSTLPEGTVHKVPADLKRAILKNLKTKNTWPTLTPLMRNEWICWVEGAKLIETRERRIKRTVDEISEGKRRPCCWPGCMHREKNGR